MKMLKKAARFEALAVSVVRILSADRPQRAIDRLTTVLRKVHVDGIVDGLGKAVEELEHQVFQLEGDVDGSGVSCELEKIVESLQIDADHLFVLPDEVEMEDDTSYPMQPIVVDDKGVHRFRENPIVTYLLDNGGIDLHQLVMRGFPREAYEQFSQLIGYSVSGFGSLSYVSDQVRDTADAISRALSVKEKPGSVTFSIKPLDVEVLPYDEQKLHAAAEQVVDTLEGFDDHDDEDDKAEAIGCVESIILAYVKKQFCEETGKVLVPQDPPPTRNDDNKESEARAPQDKARLRKYANDIMGLFDPDSDEPIDAIEAQAAIEDLLNKFSLGTD